jgi:hypothetical protein
MINSVEHERRKVEIENYHQSIAIERGSIYYNEG